MRLLGCFAVDQIQNLIALARSCKISFDAEDGLGLEWFPRRFDENFVTQVPAYDGGNQGGAFSQAQERVSF